MMRIWQTTSFRLAWTYFCARMFLQAFLPILLFASMDSLEAESIRSLSPQGSVKKVNQVVVQFSEAIVPLGDARTGQDPLTISCNIPAQKLADRSVVKGAAGKLAYTSRWIDGERWSLDFVDTVPSGVRCQLQIDPQFKDLKGNALEVGTTKVYEFQTGGPAILASWPIQDWSAASNQIFLLILDTAVDEASLTGHVYFEVEGDPGQIKPVWIKGAEKKSLLGREPYLQFLKDQKLAIPQSDEAENGKQVLLVKPERTFPDNKRVVLHWDKGVRAKSGIEVSEAQTLGWHIPEAFKARVECQRSAEDRACSPMSDLQINFNRSVTVKSLKGTTIRTKDGKSYQPREFLKEDGTPVENDRELWGLSVPGPFPASSEIVVTLPNNVQAVDGSVLSNQKSFPLTLKTDITPPLLKFAAPFGILEAKANPVLPVSVRNIELKNPMRTTSFPAQSLNLTSASAAKDIIAWYKKVRDKDVAYHFRNESIFDEKTPKTSFSLPSPTNPSALNLIGIPLPKPGFHIVEIESPVLGQVLIGEDKGPMFVASAALVTDMAVHFKIGRESSLVWVTQLSTGSPVGQADVAVYNGNGEELFTGKTDAQGLLKIKKELLPSETGGETDYEARELFAFAKQGADVSFVSSRWDQGIETYRFEVSQEYLNPRWGPTLMHSVLDRVTVQPGETVNMKHVLRQHTEQGFAGLKPDQLPVQVLLVHQGSQQVYPLPFEWDQKTGTALNTFKVPPDAKLGTYHIYLSAAPKREEAPEGAELGQGSGYELWGDRISGTFRVAEYRLPLVDAQVKIQGQPLVAPTEVKVDLSAAYLSGGPAQGLKTKLRSLIVSDSFIPETPETSAMSFFTAPIKTGVFDSYYGYVMEDGSGQSSEELAVQDLTLNKEGGSLATVKGLGSSVRARRLRLEWEYKDPNGEIRTARSEAPLYPAAVAIGIEAEQWMVEAGKAKVKGVVVDLAGKTLADRAFQVEGFSKTFVTHRKKLAGGFYSYDSKVEIKSIGVLCQGRSDAQGRFVCDLSKVVAGEYSLQASTKDDKGRTVYGRANLSVYSKGAFVWFPSGDSDRMDIVAERKHYEPGETAKVVVRSPYESSQVLVTVEREGVIDAYVGRLNRDKPFVEVPIKGNYAPNVFISVVSVRGRVADPQPTALIDLAKPSLKMGLTSIKVGWRAHSLKVDVSTDKKVYQARDKVQVKIRVTGPDNKPLPKNSEVAVVAVDEALLKLKANGSWDLLAAMMNERSLAVNTATSQLQVIGRRHFGLKAQAPGGGGGQGPGAREFFDPMLLWAPRVTLDGKGEANVTVTLNDAMTSFRIVAVAQAGQGWFGDGQTLIQANKDLLVLSGFAPFVREGDSVRNTLTLRNTSREAMNVALSVSSPDLKDLPTFPEIALGPSEAKVIEVPFKVPEGVNQLNFQVDAKDKRTGRSDILKIQEKVLPVWKAQVMQATLFQLEQNQSLDVKRPADALPEKGGLAVTARPSLTAGLGSLQGYMEQYPYTCLEQKLSKAVALDRRRDIERVVDQLPSYMDGDGLLKFFPVMSCGNALLTRYVLDILEAEKVAIPDVISYQILNGLSNWVEGRNSCERSQQNSAQPKAYEAEAKLRVIEILSRYKRFQPQQLSLVPMTPNHWQSGTVAALAKLARRETSIPEATRLVEQSEQILRSRLNFQGTLLNLQGELLWMGAWQLWTTPDYEALSVLDYALSQGKAWDAELPRMTRGMMARMKNGVWDTTLANASGAHLFRRFRDLYEKEPVAGQTQLSLAGSEENIAWDKKPLVNQKLLPWPKEQDKNSQVLRLKHEGSGKPWVQIQSLAAIPLKSVLDKGYLIKKSLHPVTQKTPGVWSVGDVVDVHLNINAQADQGWVVVRDPIPAGAGHLGTGLDGESAILDKDKAQNSAQRRWPIEYAERAQDAFVAYAAYLPKGEYLLTYRLRMNAPGVFKLSPTRTEAMYAPESYGEAPHADWTIAP